MSEPQGNLLTAGRRLHLHHGPIDLIMESFGVAAEVLVSYQQARERFRTVLAKLVCELPLLRTPIGEFYSDSAAPNFVLPEQSRRGNEIGLRQAQPERKRRELNSPVSARGEAARKLCSQRSGRKTLGVTVAPAVP